MYAGVDMAHGVENRNWKLRPGEEHRTILEPFLKWGTNVGRRFA